MNAKEFIARVVPDDGTYYIATMRPGVEGMHQTPATSLDDIGNKLKTLHKNHDTYFATASFNNNKTRASDNVKSKKALYLDLDCGPTKEFPTQRDALTALITFVRAAKLPKWSMLVNSGNGVHVYWTFMHAVGKVTWDEMAKALKELCVAHGFPADKSCTADAVRILRVPGTLNYKDPTSPKKCQLIGEAGKDVDATRLYTQLCGGPPLSVVVPVDAQVSNDDLAGDQKAFQNPPAADVFTQCATMRHSLKTGGKDDNEAMWQAQIHVLSFLGEDGLKYAHLISKDWAGYSEQEVTRKFEAKVSSSSTGPTGCAVFAITGGNHCHDCPHYPEVKNPLRAGLIRPASELPSKYRDTPSGTECLVSGEDGDSVWMQITPYRFSAATINRPQGDTVDYFRCIVNLGAASPVTIEIPLGIMMDFRSMLAVLGSYNLVFKTQDQKNVVGLIMNWTERMKYAKVVTQSPNKLGWMRMGDRRGFALAREIAWQDGTCTKNDLPNHELLQNYTPHGDLAGWQAAAKLITGHPNIEMQIALASAFAAPLMKLTNTPGAILALVSQASGIGKTKALQTAQAVWGRHDHMNHMNDTENAIIKKMGVLNNLPAYWDELYFSSNSPVDAERFINTLFRMAQGKEKARLDAKTRFRTSGDWFTLITIVSNDSLNDHIGLHRASTDAGNMRLLELDITDPKPCSMTTLATALHTFGQLEHNYGVAGEVYAKTLAKNLDSINASIHNTIDKLSNSSILKGTGQSQRMRIALVASLIVGASIAKNAGICDFDLLGIRNRLVRQLKPAMTRQGTVKTERITASKALREYMDEFADSTNVSTTYRSRGRSALDTKSSPARLPVRCHVAGVRVRIDRGHFARWVTGKYGGGTRVVAELMAEPSAIEVRSNLDAGLKSEITAKRDRLIEIAVP